MPLRHTLWQEGSRHLVPSHRLQVGSSPGHLVGHLVTWISSGSPYHLQFTWKIAWKKCLTCLATCSTFSIVSGFCSTWKGYMYQGRRFNLEDQSGSIIFAHQKNRHESEMNQSASPWLDREEEGESLLSLQHRHTQCCQVSDTPDHLAAIWLI